MTRIAGFDGWALIRVDDFVLLDDDVAYELTRAIEMPIDWSLPATAQTPDVAPNTRLPLGWRLHKRMNGSTAQLPLTPVAAERARVFLARWCTVNPTRHGGHLGRYRARLTEAGLTLSQSDPGR